MKFPQLKTLITKHITLQKTKLKHLTNILQNNVLQKTQMMTYQELMNTRAQSQTYGPFTLEVFYKTTAVALLVSRTSTPVDQK